MFKSMLARTAAEWRRDTDARPQCREYDREASQVDPTLDEQEKGIIRTFMMGSKISKKEIAKINEDKSGKCDYCKEEDVGIEHVPWKCSFFKRNTDATDVMYDKFVEIVLQ